MKSSKREGEMHVLILGQDPNVNLSVGPRPASQPRTEQDMVKDRKAMINSLPRPSSSAINTIKARMAATGKPKSKPSSPTRPQSAPIDIHAKLHSQLIQLTLDSSSEQPRYKSPTRNAPVGAHNAGYYTKLGLRTPSVIMNNVKAKFHIKEVNDGSNEKIAALEAQESLTRSKVAPPSLRIERDYADPEVKFEIDSYNDKPGSARLSIRTAAKESARDAHPSRTPSRSASPNIQSHSRGSVMFVDGRNRLSIAASGLQGAAPDYVRIELHLSTLTDNDGKRGPSIDAANHLVKMSQASTEPPIHQAFYECGMVSVLVSIFKRHTWPEVTASACLLISFLTSNSPPAYNEFVNLGGMSLLLHASEVCAKGYLDIKTKFEKRSQQPDFTRSNTMGLGRTLTTRHENIPTIMGEGKLIGIEESLLSLSHQWNEDAPSVNLNHVNNSEKLESFRTVSVQRLPLTEGFLGHYFQPGYMDQLEKMDKVQTWTVINQILFLFSKLDGLWTSNSVNAMDVNLLSTCQHIIVDGVALLSASHLGIYLIDPETEELYDWADEKDTSHKFPPDHGIVGYSVRIGELVNVRDPFNCEIFESDIDAYEEDPPKSLMSIPIYGQDSRIIGVIKAANKLSDDGSLIYFNEEDEYLLKALGSMAGTMLGNVRLYDATKATQKKIEVLLATTRSLGSILQIDKLIKSIMDSAKELLNVDRCTFFLDDPEKKRLRALIQGRDSVQTISIPYNAGIAGAVFTTGVPINIQDAYKDSRFNPEVDKQTGYVTRTILCMPIKNIQGECIGVTQMINKRKGVFSPEDEMMLSSFSAQGHPY